MNFLKLLIFAAVGAIIFAVLYDGHGGIRLPGISLSAPAPSASANSPGGASSASPWSSPGGFSPSASSNSRGGSPAAPSPGSAPNSEPNLVSSLTALFKNNAANLTGSHVTRSHSEMKIARGIVRDQTDSGVVLDCGRWVIRGLSGEIYAGDGRGMNPIGANLVDAHEKQKFGWLMSVDSGVMRRSPYDPSLWTPESYLEGTLLIKGLPATGATIGKGMKFVVVPTGSGSWNGSSIPAYTADFTLND